MPFEWAASWFWLVSAATHLPSGRPKRAQRLLLLNATWGLSGHVLESCYHLGRLGRGIAECCIFPRLLHLPLQVVAADGRIYERKAIEHWLYRWARALLCCAALCCV